MKLNTIISTATVLFTLAGISSQAEAAAIRFYRFHGSTCQPQTNTGANNILYNQYGVANLSTNSAITVVCPLTVDTTSAVNEVMTNMSQLIYYDRNPNANQNVVCVLEGLGSDGTISFTQQMVSPPGSAAAPQQFLFNPASAGSSDRSWTMTCTLPPMVNNNVSHIASILLTTQF